MYDVINSIASDNCSYLCDTSVYSVCRTNMQQKDKFQLTLKVTNCSGSAKRCISGSKLFPNNYLQIFTHRVPVLKRFYNYDLTFLDLSLWHETSYLKINTSIKYIFPKIKKFSLKICPILPLMLALVKEFKHAFFFCLIALNDSDTWSYIVARGRIF